MIAASLSEERRTLSRRVRAWRQTDAGRLAWYVVRVAVVTGLYYGAARAGLRLAYLHGSVTALWPPVGVGIAALVIGGLGLWPGIVVGDLLVADFSTPWGTVLGQTIGNTLEVVVGAVLFLLLAGRRTGLDRVRDVLVLLISAAVATLISATFGVVSLRLGHVIGASEFGTVFRTWWLSDFCGALVFAPLLLVWSSRRSWRISGLRAAEGALLLAVLIVLTELPSQEDVPYIVFPVLIWAALRFGPLGAATTVAIASTLSVWNTAQGSGPFVRGSITHSLLATQLFVAVAALTSLVLAAETAERSASEEVQRELTGKQAALRRIATLVAAEAASKRVFEEVTVEAAQTIGASAASLARFDPENAVIIGAWSQGGSLAFPTGSSISLEAAGVLAAVRDTGEPQRIHRYDELAGPIVERMSSFGYGSATAVPIELGGEVWGALVVAGAQGESLPLDAERQLADFAELVAQALANAEAYRKLADSRARIVQATDSERRRLERNLHDGAQQRLVSLALQLQLMKTAMKSDPATAASLLAQADDELGQALRELRELARGIHPATLTTHGLQTALEALTRNATIPIHVTRIPDERLPEPIEAAIYYLVAEAVANVLKYAQATQATVAVERSNGAVRVVVADDGVGGAEPGNGTGLVGLIDRIEALDGRLRIESARGHGTRLSAVIPCD